MNKRKLSPFGDLEENTDIEKLFSALAKSIDVFGREHGKKGTTGGFSGPFAMRIMASLQKYIDGEDIQVVCDRLLTPKRAKTMENPNPDWKMHTKKKQDK